MNWNVYKVFKNGKRAKAPLTVFEFDGDSNSAEEHFRVVIQENFKEKYRDMGYSILRADLPQERVDLNKEDDKLRQKQILVLGRCAREKGLQFKRKTIGGLIFASATHWKWQWCVLESATCNFLAGLSPRFDNSSEADAWMTQQVQNLK
tara:strand:+ start:770 stop:1216 length:447 start_codon:yes stop_codon:yes gene_type:complete